MAIDRNGFSEPWVPEPAHEPPQGRGTRRFWRRRNVVIVLAAVALLLIFGGDAMAHSLMHVTGSGCGGG
jgi:hypothetical protein